MNTTWETSTLRTWLNKTFLIKAFNSLERNIILTTNVDNSKSQGYNENSDNDTQDKVFLLSLAEIKKYYKNIDARVCLPTEYAVYHGTYLGENNGK